jgi:aminoglycoside phosphotransferase (APT) family kinase protein
LSTLATTIEQTAPATSNIPFHPIHWDFHVDQLLTDQGKLTFCDLDEVIVGDPIQDLAHFVVDLHVRLPDRDFAHLIGAELCHQYQPLVTWEIQAERLAWHIRIQMVNKAYRHYLRFAPGFEEIVEGMIRLAQRGLTA